MPSRVSSGPLIFCSQSNFPVISHHFPLFNQSSSQLRLCTASSVYLSFVFLLLFFFQWIFPHLQHYAHHSSIHFSRPSSDNTSSARLPLIPVNAVPPPHLLLKTCPFPLGSLHSVCQYMSMFPFTLFHSLKSTQRHAVHSLFHSESCLFTAGARTSFIVCVECVAEGSGRKIMWCILLVCPMGRDIFCNVGSFLTFERLLLG